MKYVVSPKYVFAAALSVALIVAAGPARAQVLVKEWNLAPLRAKMPDTNYRFCGSSAPGQLFFAGEPVHVRLALKKGKLRGTVRDFAIEVQGIHTRRPNKNTKVYVDPFGHPDVLSLDGDPVVQPIAATFGDRPEAELEVRDLRVPGRFGTYALILTRGEKFRQFLATVARVPRPRDGGTVENTPIFGEGQFLDRPEHYDARAAALHRMGIRGIRRESHWTERKDGSYDWARQDKLFAAMAKHNVKVMVTLGAVPSHFMPFGEPTPAANWKGNPYGGRADWLCDPKLYPRYAKWIEAFCRRYWKDGKGALWAIEHYNEPWEGGGISGWARDCIQYRKMLKMIAAAARKVSPEIRISAASSIMNTEDKLYSDGSREFDRCVDIFTDHYVRPPACYGPMVAAAHGKISMETETWLVISEYLLPVTVCRFLAAGQRAIAPWHPRVLFDPLPGTKDRYFIPTTVPVATAAFNHFVTGKPFERIVFRSHLPWVFQFGRDDDPDGLLVLFGQLLSAGGDSPAKHAANRPWRQVDAAEGGTLTLDNRDSLLRFHDLAGNEIFRGRKTVQLPMSFLPTYIRCAKGPKAAAERVRRGRIEKKRPVEILPRDFTCRVDRRGSALTVGVHNCLNRSIRGMLRVAAPRKLLRLAADTQVVQLRAGQTQELTFPLIRAAVAPSNNYPVTFHFTSDAGNAEHREVLSAAIAPKGARKIDGDLADWEGSPGILLAAKAEEVDFTERARRPWIDWKAMHPDGTFAELKLAWDDANLYLAARVHDPSPQTDHDRLAGRDENAFFHSAASDRLSPYKEWLAKKHPGRSFAEVPFVYRTPPFNTAWAGDRIQIALNVRDDWHDLAPTTDRVPYGFHAVPDTDYEFSLYLCRDGKSELWRLLAPGLPRIHDFPRQPRGKLTTGPVPGARHVVRQDGNTRTYEAAIPQAAVRHLKLQAGTKFKFTFQVGNNKGPGILYGRDKAAVRNNGLTLHPYWLLSPSCDVVWALVE